LTGTVDADGNQTQDSDDDVADLTAFLNALTGETAHQRPLGPPDQVPSGLPVD